MKTLIDLKFAVAQMRDEEGTAQTRGSAALLIALVELRETIEEAFARLDQTHLEAAAMLVGCKESFDGFVDQRLKADKVLAGVVATMLAKPPGNGEKPTPPVDEPKKSGVTLDVGDFGGPVGGSGIA